MEELGDLAGEKGRDVPVRRPSGDGALNSRLHVIVMLMV